MIDDLEEVSSVGNVGARQGVVDVKLGDIGFGDADEGIETGGG